MFLIILYVILSLSINTYFHIIIIDFLQRKKTQKMYNAQLKII